MSKIQKLLNKFFSNPTSLNYIQIEKILFHFNFYKIQAKGSHVKFNHKLLTEGIIIAVHNNDCKKAYKNHALKLVEKILKSYN